MAKAITKARRWISTLKYRVIIFAENPLSMRAGGMDRPRSSMHITRPGTTLVSLKQKQGGLNYRIPVCVSRNCSLITGSEQTRLCMVDLACGKIKQEVVQRLTLMQSAGHLDHVNSGGTGTYYITDFSGKRRQGSGWACLRKVVCLV